MLNKPERLITEMKWSMLELEARTESVISNSVVEVHKVAVGAKFHIGFFNSQEKFLF